MVVDMSITPEAMAKTQGRPGLTNWARVMPHRTLAHSSTRVPARVIGVVAPGWESTST